MNHWRLLDRRVNYLFLFFNGVVVDLWEGGKKVLIERIDVVLSYSGLYWTVF
jgi:hypothetical protein